MEWTKEKTMFFLQLIRDRPVLWDNTLEDRDKHKKLEALSEIAKVFGLTKEEVNSKWTSLKGQYNREKKKAGLRTGSGADIYTSKWFAYQEMASLLSGNMPQESITFVMDYANVEDTDVDSDSAITTPQTCKSSPKRRFSMVPLAPKRKKDDDFITSALDRLEAISRNVNVQTVKTEFDIFGQSVARQLSNMQLEDALQMQLQIQQMLINHRLKKLQTPEYFNDST